jgi:hypothetical protein
MMGGMTQYTDQERQTLRTAAFGAVYMVSNAEPGFFDMVKESFAGSRAFAQSPELRDILRSGGLPKMPQGSPEDIEKGVLSALTESQTILESKGGEELSGFRTAVSSAVDDVANAGGGGATTREQEAIGKVRSAIGA